MADNTADDIMKRLQNLLATASENQARVIERYANIYQQLLHGDLGETDPAKWGQFWVDEATRFARGITQLNVTYAESMLALGEDFARRLENMVAREDDDVATSGA
jgi:hypothetical protein